MALLRVGSVPYRLARPLDEGLADEVGVELERRVPAELAAGLRAGELDVALVSSIELFRRPGYSYLDGPAVAGMGPVSSVQVFLRRPLPEVRSLALDPASRTAAALAQVVWPPAVGRPELVRVPSGMDPRAAEADAWLRIGDPALVERLSPEAPLAVDPCLLWVALTGLPFVFAAWVARPGVDLEPWAGAFARAFARGRARREEMAAEAGRALELPLAATRRYLLEELVYEPPGGLAPSLIAFRDRAAALELCRGDLAPRAVAVPAPV